MTGSPLLKSFVVKDKDPPSQCLALILTRHTYEQQAQLGTPGIFFNGNTIVRCFPIRPGPSATSFSSALSGQPARQIDTDNHAMRESEFIHPGVDEHVWVKIIMDKAHWGRRVV